ncbi:hypothetical protein AAY473_008504 [Plecturocebus cupreus]
MGFHHVAQAGLELLSSGNPPTSASQSARITVFTRAVKVILLLQLLLALFTDIEEVDVGHSQLLSFRDLAQGPELNSGAEKAQLDTIQKQGQDSSTQEESWSKTAPSSYSEIWGYHYIIAQADLELLTSSDPPSSASQSAGMTNMSYQTLPLPAHLHHIKGLACQMEHIHPHSQDLSLLIHPALAPTSRTLTASPGFVVPTPKP